MVWVYLIHYSSSNLSPLSNDEDLYPVESGYFQELLLHKHGRRAHSFPNPADFGMLDTLALSTTITKQPLREYLLEEWSSSII